MIIIISWKIRSAKLFFIKIEFRFWNFELLAMEDYFNIDCFFVTMASKFRKASS